MGGAVLLVCPVWCTKKGTFRTYRPRGVQTMRTDRREFLKLALGMGGATMAAAVVSPSVLYASSGSYTYTGSETTNGSWAYERQWTQDGGFRQVGPVRYKVERLHKQYKRTQTKRDTYERLTVVLG